VDEVRAKLRFAPSSAQKMRRVIRLVRGKAAAPALAMLQNMPQAAARDLAKLLRSAIANAEENVGMRREDLLITQIYADEGPTRKWRRFGARGRFKPILRRSSHVTIVLGETAEK
jgi:large subunit ribosomal protein L22